MYTSSAAPAFPGGLPSRKRSEAGLQSQALLSRPCAGHCGRKFEIVFSETLRDYVLSAQLTHGVIHGCIRGERMNLSVSKST